MCTVSFIPSKDKIFITSNRDEKNTRARAFAPGIEHHLSKIKKSSKRMHQGMSQNMEDGVLMQWAQKEKRLA